MLKRAQRLAAIPGQYLCGPPGRGRAVLRPPSSETAATTAGAAPERDDDVALSHIVGVVKRPQISAPEGTPMWQCVLAVTQVGASCGDIYGEHQIVIAQDQVVLKCRGLHWYEYCVQHLHQDALVHVVALLLQRPKFVAIHSNYRYDIELQVTPHVGSVRRIPYE